MSYHHKIKKKNEGDNGTETCLVIGLNSGTSMDGVDAVLIEISEEKLDNSKPRFHQVGFLTWPYSAGLKEDLVRISVDGKVAEVCAYNVLLGRVFADAARAVVTQAGRKMEEVALIGSHGQTVHHLPSPQNLHGYSISSTLQIGDPSVIANLCGVTTVGDFRMADVSVGGQGAPLAPYFDDILLRRYRQETGRIGVILNIGGISNISTIYTDDEGKDKMIGFDCGPGNILVDSLVKQLYGKDYDKDGGIAKSGNTSNSLLQDLLMQDRFISRAIPKSTGREHYNAEYLDAVVKTSRKLELSNEDIMATVTEFTAVSVGYNFDEHIRPLYPEEEIDMFVCGGGVKNEAMVEFLKQRLRNVRVSSTIELGVDPDSREAVFFAVLAYQTYKGRPTNPSNVTGAERDVIQGKICPISSQLLP